MTWEEWIEMVRDDCPRWFDEEYCDPESIAAIQQGGCASGAYMPAVTYHSAAQIMAEYGDDVLDYLENGLGELPPPPDSVSWSGLACHYLSCAVELWCSHWDVDDIDDGGAS